MIVLETIIFLLGLTRHIARCGISLQLYPPPAFQFAYIPLWHIGPGGAPYRHIINVVLIARCNSKRFGVLGDV